jgi:hypothetical protein
METISLPWSLQLVAPRPNPQDLDFFLHALVMYHTTVSNQDQQPETYRIGMILNQELYTDDVLAEA